MRARQHPFIFVPLLALLAATGFPQPRGYVNDFAGVLDPTAHRRLEARLSAYEQETTNQIAIALFPSLEGRTIDEVGVKLFEEWKIGKRGKDNGILIVVGLKERRVRIDVGYGLEGKVPDAQTGRIIREMIAPSFQQDRYAEGVERAVEELIALIGGTTTAPPPVPTPRRRTSDPWVLYGILAAGGLLLSYLVQRTAQRRCPRCGTLLQRDNAVRPGLASRSVVYVCPKCGYRENVVASSGGFMPIFFGGGGWGSGGSGGSGFSGFGGGSSGGGGASGSW